MGDWPTALTRHLFKIRRAASQSVGSAAFTSLSFDTEDEDTDGGFAVTSTTYTVKVAGFWHIHAFAQVVSPAASKAFLIQISINAAAVSSAGPYFTTASAYDARGSAFYDGRLAVGDAVTVEVYQDSGVNKNCTGFCSGWMVAA